MLHLPGRTEGDVVRLRLAQGAGEGKLLGVLKMLAGEHQEGIGVDGVADLLDDRVAQRLFQVGAGQAGAEFLMQRGDGKG